MAARPRAAVAGCLPIVLGLAASPLQAQQAAPAPTQVQQAAPAPAQEAAASEQPNFGGSLWQRNNLLGDVGGVRSTLWQYGITIGLQETSEVLGNVTGGIRTGAAYDGVTQMGIGLDTTRAFGWQGGTFNISALQIHGQNLSTENLATIQTASGIEADRSTRLWELWYQQAIDKFDIKIGQQSIDQEFITSANSGIFVNTAMGWPVIPSTGLYAGGPAYPLASLGVRVRGQSLGPFNVLAGVFDDNPPGGPFNNDSQLRDANGARFNLNTGALFIAELQYIHNQPANGDTDEATGSTGLPGTYKFGAYFDSATFPDQRIDTSGLSLANPASTGIPRMDRHNWSIYAVADQTVWQPDPKSPQAVNLFARIMGAPADRNLISFAANAGVVLKAPLPGRDNDNFGVGYGIAKVSGSAGDLDRDTNFFTGSNIPIRSTEQFIEITYQFQAAPWWLIQPDIQYVIRPGAGILNPNGNGKLLGNELVLGLRTGITF